MSTVDIYMANKPIQYKIKLCGDPNCIVHCHYYK